MTSLDAPRGNPAALDDSVQSYLLAEQALDRAATDIASSLDEGSGRAIEAARDRSGKARSSLSAAHARYQGARAALQDYSLELHRFHHDAHTAIDHDTAAQAQVHRAELLAERARQELRVASLDPGNAYVIDEWQREYDLARNAVEYARQAAAAAAAEYAAAAEELDAAARAAMVRIVAAFEATNDSLRDHIGAAIGFITGVLEELTEWAVSFLKEVLELVVEAVAMFLAAVVVAVAVIVLAIMLVQLLSILAAVVAAIVVVAIALLVAVLAELVFLAAVGTRASLTASALGLDGPDRIRFVVTALELACPFLALFIQSRIQNELSKPVPDVEEIGPSTLDPKTPDTVDDLLAWAGQVDAAGGSTRAVVDIAHIVDEQGNASWIVTLPSTEDWVVGGDKGAPNDLDADLMLLLYPELRCQYEAAVLKAMAQAGIPHGDPVVLTGWSLGGIMGGSLIESRAGGYHYAGLVCAGSPIDHMAIPQGVPVVQVKHSLDPVHRADMIDDVADTPHHKSLWDGPRSGGASSQIKTGNLVGHSNGDYVDTLKDHLSFNANHGGPDLNADFREVLPWDDPATQGRVVVEHRQYAFSE